MDRFPEFFETYRHYAPIITPKVRLEKGEAFDEDLIQSNVCWLMSDNMSAILELQPRDTIEDTSNANQIHNFLEKELRANALITVLQDPNNMDHWFSLIGDNGNVHIVEHLPGKCNSVETMKLSNFLAYFMGIVVGLIPDRFYDSKAPHIYTMWSFTRRPLTKETVINFVNS